MPRSRILSVKASCSSIARLTQMTSSNSSSSALEGVSRACSRPGRWTMTLRSLPTSECTPNAMSGLPSGPTGGTWVPAVELDVVRVEGHHGADLLLEHPRDVAEGTDGGDPARGVHELG